MKLDTVIAGGRVIDPSAGVDERTDIGIFAGKISEIGDLSKREANNYFDATDTLALPGMIDTHGHIYQHVTGKFGLDPDLVGVHSGVTTVIDQGGPSCMTIGGFRHYLYDKCKTRTLCFISAYLVGGLEGHLCPGL